MELKVEDLGQTTLRAPHIHHSVKPRRQYNLMELLTPKALILNIGMALVVVLLVLLIAQYLILILQHLV